MILSYFLAENTVEISPQSQNLLIAAQVLTFCGIVWNGIIAWMNKKDSKHFAEKAASREDKRIQSDLDFKLAQLKIVSTEKIELAKLTLAQQQGINKNVSAGLKEVREIVEKSRDERSQQIQDLKHKIDESKVPFSSSSSSPN